MIELTTKDKVTFDRHSSKGNQLKFNKNGVWYKTDYTGYEGISEYVVSEFLKRSNLNDDEYVVYRTEQINYAGNIFRGCGCDDFLKDDAQIITLERLYKNTTGESLYKKVWSSSDDIRERLNLLVDTVEEITGVIDFGIYIAKLMTIDAVFLNEDRHFHNIAILMKPGEQYELCPIFDQGASLLSDTRMDYPLDGYLYDLYDKVKSKTVSSDFDEQLDAAEELYGDNLYFTVSNRELEDIVEREEYYSDEIKNRVKEILYHQKRRYEYLFK